jgi:transposase
MGPPHLSNAVRWQIIGMREAGMSLRQIAQRVGHHHSTVSRIVNIHRLTNDVKDRSRSERSRITSRREDNALGPLVRRNPFANSTVLKRQWLPHRLLSARTVRNRLKYVGYRSRRHIKRCLLTQVHKVFRLQWRQTRHQWNLASWRKVHWSDERRFLLHVTNGRVRVWRQPNTAYAERNIVETVTFGGGSVMVWGMSKRQPQWTNLSAKHPWSRCCASLWQSSSEYKVCLYWWQRQTPQSSCCDILLAWRVDNHTSMACQESWLKPDRAHLGHYRSSSERKNTDGSNFKWLGANTAPGMAGSYPSPNSSFSGQYEKTIIGSHPC